MGGPSASCAHESCPHSQAGLMRHASGWYTTEQCLAQEAGGHASHFGSSACKLTPNARGPSIKGGKSILSKSSARPPAKRQKITVSRKIEMSPLGARVLVQRGGFVLPPTLVQSRHPVWSLEHRHKKLLSAAPGITQVHTQTHTHAHVCTHSHTQSAGLWVTPQLFQETPTLWVEVPESCTPI